MNVDEIERASDEEVDAFLEHFGVRGMKWGHRKNPHRAEMRKLNKESRARDKVENRALRDKHQRRVELARQRVSSGKLKTDLKKAKAQYKVDKNVIGRREARKALNKVKNKNFMEVQKSREAKNGKEAAGMILLGVGGLALQAALNSRQ